MGFIKFTEKGKSFLPKASVSRSGMISFNDGARKRFYMDQTPICVLYYDPETDKVGVELGVDESVDGARKLRFRSTGADIAAKSFLDFFEIYVPQTLSYDVTKDSESGLLIIDMAHPLASTMKKQRHDG